MAAGSAGNGTDPEKEFHFCLLPSITCNKTFTYFEISDLFLFCIKLPEELTSANTITVPCGQFFGEEEWRYSLALLIATSLYSISGTDMSKGTNPVTD